MTTILDTAVACELVALRQALALAGDHVVQETLRPLVDAVADAVPPLDVDRTLSPDIAAVLALLEGSPWLRSRRGLRSPDT
jgi:histidine ammonia-lyase